VELIIEMGHMTKYVGNYKYVGRLGLRKIFMHNNKLSFLLKSCLCLPKSCKCLNR